MVVVVLSRNLPHERLPTAVVNRRVTNVRPRLSNGEIETVTRTKQAGYPGWGPIFVSLRLRILGQMLVASFLRLDSRSLLTFGTLDLFPLRATVSLGPARLALAA